jgi:hypothetical protein
MSSSSVPERRDCSPRESCRLHSISHPGALAAIELGAEFVHGRPAGTYALLREYGETVVDDAQTSFVFCNGALEAAGDDRFAIAGSLLATALDRDDDESVDALIARRGSGEPARDAARRARRLVSGFDAADPARASARAVANEWAGGASADGAQSRPSGGYAPLIAHLRRSLNPDRVDVRYDAVVTTIARNGGAVRISDRIRGHALTVCARRALVTVPKASSPPMRRSTARSFSSRRFRR